MRSQIETTSSRAEEEGSREKHLSADSRCCKEDASTVLRDSPLTVMFQQVKGTRSFYMFIASIFAYIIVYEELKYSLDAEAKAKRNQFFYDQFASLPLFMKLWLQMHMILYFIVYPAGKYFASYGKSSLILTGAVFTSLGSMKYMLYSELAKHKSSGDELSISLGLALGCESTRLFMKLIAFLIECNDVSVRQASSLVNFTRFLFLPTLVYKAHWVQVKSPGSLKRAVLHLLHFIILVYILGLWFFHFVFPEVTHLRRTVISKNALKKTLILKLFFLSSWSYLFIYLSIGFSFLHFYMNSAADFMNYPDRIFYKIWWNSSSIGELMRSWNHLVHSWLQTYIFKPLIGKTGIPIAAVIVFAVSGIYHDWILLVAFGFFCPLFTVIMAFTPIPVTINRLIFGNSLPVINLFSMAIAAYLQMGTVIFITILEYEARSLCPSTNSTSPWRDSMSLRFIQCFSFE